MFPIVILAIVVGGILWPYIAAALPAMAYASYYRDMPRREYRIEDMED